MTFCTGCQSTEDFSPPTLLTGCCMNRLHDETHLFLQSRHRFPPDFSLPSPNYQSAVTQTASILLLRGKKTGWLNCFRLILHDFSSLFLFLSAHCGCSQSSQEPTSVCLTSRTLDASDCFTSPPTCLVCHVWVMCLLSGRTNTHSFCNLMFIRSPCSVFNGNYTVTKQPFSTQEFI